MTGRISDDPDVGTLAGTEFIPVVTGGLNKRTTPAELNNYIASLGGGVTYATTAQYLANVPNLGLATDRVWAAAGLVPLTDAATIAVDMSTFINASVTLGGNRILGTPVNSKIGQAGVIQITQDSTGSRTLTYGAGWKFAGGTIPLLTTTAGAVDLLFYQVFSPAFILGTLIGNVH